MDPAVSATGATTATPGRIGIRPADGAEALARLVAVPLGPQVVVTAIPLPDYLAEVGGFTSDAVEVLAADAARSAPARPRPDSYVAPRTDLEASVVGLFAEVLGGEAIGVDDDFFDLGGNSLVAVQLIALIRKRIQVKLPMRSLFEEPTAAGVARLIEQVRAEGGGAEAGEDAAEPGTQGSAAGLTITRQPRRADASPTE